MNKTEGHVWHTQRSTAETRSHVEASCAPLGTGLRIIFYLLSCMTPPRPT